MKRPVYRALVGCLGLALAVGGMVSGVPASASPASHPEPDAQQHIGIPAYWSPNSSSGMDMFDQLAQNVPATGIAIINGPTSSAPIPFNQATATAIEHMHAAGIKVLGYVDTGYLGRYGSTTTRYNRGSTDVADWQQQMRSDADAWYDLYGRYGIDGIFFDETISSCGPDNAYVNDYKSVTDYVRTEYRGSYVTINPGTTSDECYLSVADTVMIFENTYSVYQSWKPPAYVSKYPANRFWNLVYDVPTQAGMEDAVARSKANNAGYVYVSNRILDATHFPWDMLPTSKPYWDDELLQVSGGTDTVRPDEPRGVHATSTSCSASECAGTLVWKPAQDNVAVVGYDVYQGATLLETVDGNSATFSGLKPDTPYRFTVRARDEAGNVGAGSHAVVALR